MSTQAGALLWNRQHLVLPFGLTTVDTGLRQVNKPFASMSPDEPILGVEAAPPGPADGTEPPSRVMVIPEPPLSGWATITHGEPFVDPMTGTVKVTFNNNGEGSAEINVLFWDPHSIAGPGAAVPYNPAV